jgi:HD superfamily phosphohydrolase
MEAIKDAVHDAIEIRGVAQDLLDTEPVQRLRHITQLSTVELVYPSANHTRFEHSLGVYHLADRALAQLGVEGRRAERVRAAALLHDVGHGPFGHQTEDVIRRRLGRHHDEVHHLLERDGLASVLEAHDLDPAAVADLVAGDGVLGQLVSGELDVDRMDYLVRDAHHTGVPYGTIDHDRLVRGLALVDGGLVLGEGNVQAAESVLVARTLMNATVYRHHVSRIAAAMLERASDRLLDAAEVTPEAFSRLTDDELLAALRDHPETADAADRLVYRDLYKRAAWLPLDDAPESVLDADHDRIRDLEAAVASDAGVDPDRVVLDVPPRPGMRESETRVVVDGDVRRLSEVSPLVSALEAAHREQWRLGAYAPESARDRVARATERALGVES